MLKNLFSGKPSSMLIEAAYADISEMLAHSESMLDHALATLLDNQPLEVDLDVLDDPVDEGERMVRRTVLEHLAVNPQQELVTSLVLVSMVQDAERLGDFARGIGNVAALAKSPRGGPFADRLREAAQRIKPLFGLCNEGFREGSRELTRKVWLEAKAVRGDLRRYIGEVAASDLSADMAVVYASAARSLQRIAAHLGNIASSVVQPYDRIRHGDEDA